MSHTDAGARRCPDHRSSRVTGARVTSPRGAPASFAKETLVDPHTAGKRHAKQMQCEPSDLSGGKTPAEHRVILYGSQLIQHNLYLADCTGATNSQLPKHHFPKGELRSTLSQTKTKTGDGKRSGASLLPL